MRVLVVSFYFPPFNSIGGVRVGKMVKYLRRRGHEVRVVTAGSQALPETLPVEVPRQDIVRTRWLNVNRPAEILIGGRGRVSSRGYVLPSGAGARARALVKRLAGWYKELLHIPDGEIGWYPFAVAAGVRLSRRWRPDLIYASARPYTSLLVARTLSDRLGVPWVGEFRDLWADNHSVEYSTLRRRLDRALERRTVATASALVTVSEPLAETLRANHRVPVSVVLNGYDLEDYPPRSRETPRPSAVSVAYTGMAYPGKQDPGPLFEALRRMRCGGGDVEVQFYGRYLDWVATLAADAGVSGQVAVHPVIPYRDALRVQREADLLLLLLWRDESNPGVYTGKLFEYLGARRPILAIGPKNGVAAELIRARRAGIVVQTASELLPHLEAWVSEKRSRGGIPDLPESVGRGFSRGEQVVALEEVFRGVVDAEPRTGKSPLSVGRR